MKLHKWHPENGQHIHGFHSPKTPLRKIPAMIGNERIFSRKSCSKVNSYSQIHFSSMVSTWIFDNKPTNQTTKRPNHQTTKQPTNQGKSTGQNFPDRPQVCILGALLRVEFLKLQTWGVFFFFFNMDF